MDTRLQGHLAGLEDDFVVALNHEIRTPLASVMGNLEILIEARNAVDPRFDRQLDAISRGVERLSLVVNEILRDR